MRLMNWNFFFMLSQQRRGLCRTSFFSRLFGTLDSDFFRSNFRYFSYLMFERLFVQYVCTVTVHTLIAYTNIWEYFSMGHILKKSKKVYFCNKGGLIKDELFRGLTF